MDFYGNYMSNIRKTPDERYKASIQATLDAQWTNTTQLRTIKEQVFPFEEKYTEQKCWISTVTDPVSNVVKYFGDYIEILFRDIDHPLNYKGTKYLYDTNGNGEETYLCYDRINSLSPLPQFKAIRCNNVLKWKDIDNGQILQEPCFLGYELTATNNQINKEGIQPSRRLVVLIQCNKNTSKFVTNQRFMLGHKKVFKITEINDVVMSDTALESAVTMLQIDIEWDALLDKDNTELNVCDYYDNVYTVEINSEKIEQLKGYEGDISAVVKLDGEIVEHDIIWQSSDTNIVTIDEFGHYKLLGEGDQTATITCMMADNSDIFDTVEVKILSASTTTKELRVSPVITTLYEGDEFVYNCGVYIDEIKQEDTVTCTPDWTGLNYILEKVDEGYKLTNTSPSKKPLVLTFSADGCEDIVLTVKLNGLI